MTVQVINNPHFTNGLTGWTVIQPAGTTISVTNGVARIVRVTPASGPSLRQSVLVIGHPYRFTIKINDLVGGAVFGVNFAGQQFPYTTPGIKQFTVASVGGTDVLTTLGANNTSIDIEYMFAERLDQNMSRSVLTYRDNDGDKKQFSIPGPAVTDGATFTATLALHDAVVDALLAVTLGNPAGEIFAAIDLEPNNNNAADPAAQAHITWTLIYTDQSTGAGPYKLLIPTADLNTQALRIANSQHHDPANALWIALKSALTNYMRSPANNGITIQEIFLTE